MTTYHPNKESKAGTPILSARARLPRSQGGMILRRVLAHSAFYGFAVGILAAPPGYKILQREPGGFIPRPEITSMTLTQGLTLNWIGYGGPYQILVSTNLNAGDWQVLGTVTNTQAFTVPQDAPQGFVRVKGTAPVYVGAERCGLCHIDTHDEWTNTLHAQAFETLKKIGQSTNASCVVCHVVGLGQPSGFQDEATTPGLAGVQCENCHGPGGDHVRNPLNEAKRPLVALSAMVCGGCHSAIHHPTFEEWGTSAHHVVTPDVASGFLDANPTNSLARMNTCGACHSGATRLAFISAIENEAQIDYPTGQEAAETGVTCAVCHDPHGKSNDSQLRYPLASKIPYSYTTATNFASQYNEQINVCGQCHNMRGAKWTDTSRPSHHSPQYNILIGDGGYVGGDTNVPQSSHMNIETQCAYCHTHPHTPPSVTETSPNYMGHDFTPQSINCAPCHDETAAGLLINVFQENTQQKINEVKTLLDQWATQKAPASLQAYGALAWEYTSIGDLSTPTATIPQGPSAKEQASVPDTIKQARYNLYLIYHDGSLGIHNGNYSRYLLSVAKTNILTELAKP